MVFKKGTLVRVKVSKDQPEDKFFGVGKIVTPPDKTSSKRKKFFKEEFGTDKVATVKFQRPKDIIPFPLSKLRKLKSLS